MINKIKAIQELLESNIETSKDLMLAKRKIASMYGVSIFSNAEVLNGYRELVTSKKIKRSERLDSVLRKRAVRTLSGIAPVAVLTKPYECPGKCAFCPTEKDVPQSYLSNEPAVMRAIRCGYNPYVQVQDRLRALIANGHEPTKIELIVIGGTWSVLPKKYKYWYILNLYKGANEFAYKTRNTKHITQRQPLASLKNELLRQQKKNEKTKYRIIGLTLETRPDYINEKELLLMREFGCTRVELGVQVIDDVILKKNKRGHGVAEIAEATKNLRRFGFKITYHIMPGLPGSTPAKDLRMFKQLFSDSRFQPDQIKFYPTVVTKGSELYQWWKQGKYRPYTDNQLQKLIIDCKKNIPEYVRVIRLIRDIPGESIEAGNKITNLRQIMQSKGLKCDCIRCREVKDGKLDSENWQIKIIKYDIVNGVDCFIQVVNKTDNTLYGFCRLMLLENKDEEISVLRSTAIIRELHVYGSLMSVGKNKKVQHAGLGKILLQEAEKISRNKKYDRITIISGVGVRGYYRKFGYRLSGGYMTKKQIY